MNNTILLSTAVGAAIGAAAGFVHNFVAKRNSELVDLGGEWPLLQADPMVFLLSEIKPFRDLNEECSEHFYFVGDQIEKLLGLWELVSNPASRRNLNWGVKAFTFRNNIFKRLKQLENDIPQARRDFAAQEKIDEEEGESSIVRDRATCIDFSLEDYRQIRDKLCEQVDNTYHNIKLELQT